MEKWLKVLIIVVVVLIIIGIILGVYGGTIFNKIVCETKSEEGKCGIKDFNEFERNSYDNRFGSKELFDNDFYQKLRDECEKIYSISSGNKCMSDAGSGRIVYYCESEDKYYLFSGSFGGQFYYQFESNPCEK